MFAGHNEPLELVDHLSKQVERLGVLLHAVCDQLCHCNHLVSKVANILGAVLDAAGRRLHSGPELLHAALLGEGRRLRMLMEVWLEMLVLCQFWSIPASIVTRGGGVVLCIGTIDRLSVVFVMRCSLPGRGGERANTLLDGWSAELQDWKVQFGHEQDSSRDKMEPCRGWGCSLIVLLSSPFGTGLGSWAG